jgi:Protein of unknown function (DUF1573)
MKNKISSFVLAIVAFMAISCKNADTQKKVLSAADIQKRDSMLNVAISDTINYTTIQWLDSMQNFKKINEGQKLEINFHFRNTGTKPLVIANVRPGCGCTVAEKPEAPIAPGKEGVIKSTFDSEGKPGPVRKSIYVSANTKFTQTHEMVFEGEVIPKAKKQ